jgi:hypothetical protein
MMRPFSASLAFLRPVVRLTRVLPTLVVHVRVRLSISVAVVYASRGDGVLVLLANGKRRGGLWFKMVSFQCNPDRSRWKCRLTLMPYQSLRVKGSWAFFLRPFLPLDNLLFLPPEYQPSKVHQTRDCCSRSCNRCKSRLFGGRNVLANSHLDEHYANRGTDVLLGLVMETVESSREIWGFLRSSRNCDFVVWALPACGKTRDVGQLLKRCDWSIGA